MSCIMAIATKTTVFNEVVVYRMPVGYLYAFASSATCKTDWLVKRLINPGTATTL